MARLGYCSACDRNVPVVLRKPLEHGMKPAADDARLLVCLDYGVRCTGDLCPLFTVPRQTGPDRHTRSDRRGAAERPEAGLT
jgi:hypothetical protein